MEESDKDLKSSVPINPSSIPSPSPSDTGESNENDVINDQLGIKNPKKPPTRHFMSPTISAASKAANPRKKVLSERNEAAADVPDIHLQKTSRTSPARPSRDRSDRSSSRVPPSYNPYSESDDDDHSNFGGDLPSKPYDPLTNYLSPRPKFLRYNPNRRRRIIAGKELKEGTANLGISRSCSFDSQEGPVEGKSSADVSDFSGSSSEEDSLKHEIGKPPQNEGIPVSDEEEFEEYEEEGDCCLKSIFKHLLLLAVLLLTTSYIVSMNSPTPSPAGQAMRDVIDRYTSIRNHVFEAVSTKILDHERVDEFIEYFRTKQMGYKDDLFGEVERIGDDGREWVESPNELSEVVEPTNEVRENVCDHELEKAKEVAENLEMAPTVVNEDVQAYEFGGKWEYSDQSKGKETVQSQSFDSDGLEKTDEDSDQLDEIIKMAEELESLQDYRRVFERADMDAVPEDASAVVTGEAGRGLTDTDVEEETIGSVFDERVSESEILNPQMEENYYTRLFNKHKKIVIGVFLSLTTLACVASVFRLARETITVATDSPSVKEELLAEPVREQTICTEICTVDEQPIGKYENFRTPLPSLMGSIEEAPKEFSQSHAPSVELLGEFVIGKASSTIRSCDSKSKMTAFEESKSMVSQEESRFRPRGAQTQSLPQPSAVELSTADSPSYGSLTAEKQISKKEEGKDEARAVTPGRRSGKDEARAVTPGRRSGKDEGKTTTPVRRSSRLRNRAMSP